LLKCEVVLSINLYRGYIDRCQYSKIASDLIIGIMNIVMPHVAHNYIPVTKIMKNSEKSLSIKQVDWFRRYIKTGKAVKSAMKAYEVDENNARTIASDNLKKIDYPLLMEYMGVGDNRLLKKLDEGLDAKRQITTGGTKDSTDAGYIEVPDYNVQHKYLTTALTLKKRLDVATTTVNVDKMLVLDGTTALNTTEPLQGQEEPAKQPTDTE
jgi:hypothetical protein